MNVMFLIEVSMYPAIGLESNIFVRAMVRTNVSQLNLHSHTF